MKYKNLKMDGYDLHILQTDKFKTVNFNIEIRFPLKRKDRFFMSLLETTLPLSTGYKTLKERNISCAEIYDPAWVIKSSLSGNQSVFSLRSSFLNEKYTEKGMTKKTIEYLLKIIFSPKIEDNHFIDEIFEKEKTNRLNYLRSLEDNPDAYSLVRLQGYMQVYDFKPVTLEELYYTTKKIDSKMLYDFYQKMLKTSKFDIFIAGDIDEDEIIKILNDKLKINTTVKKNDFHYITQKTYNSPPHGYSEPVPNNQSKALIGCKALNMTDFEKKYVFTLYSWILGGSNSLLFDDVREQHSLCYYIYTSRQSLTGTMNIFAGIDADNFDEVYDLIEENMAKIVKGDYPDEYIENAKQVYYNSLNNIEDSLDSLTSNYESEVLTGSDNIETRRINIGKVTKQDISNLAKKVHIDTIFLLKGEAHGKEDV